MSTVLFYIASPTTMVTVVLKRIYLLDTFQGQDVQRTLQAVALGVGACFEDHIRETAMSSVVAV